MYLWIHVCHSVDRTLNPYFPFFVLHIYNGSICQLFGELPLLTPLFEIIFFWNSFIIIVNIFLYWNINVVRGNHYSVCTVYTVNLIEIDTTLKYLKPNALSVRNMLFLCFQQIVWKCYFRPLTKIAFVIFILSFKMLLVWQLPHDWL